jgi:hypothetical protein
MCRSHCELGSRQKRKYLPFRKLQPPKKINGFHISSHLLTLAYTSRAVISGHVLATCNLNS